MLLIITTISDVTIVSNRSLIYNVITMVLLTRKYFENQLLSFPKQKAHRNY